LNLPLLALFVIVQFLKEITFLMSTPIYHFTHINNFQNLLSLGSILCKNKMLEQSIPCTSSAFESVQSYREGCNVPASRGGTIHDYVPFYFNSLSPMLYTISCGNIDNIRMTDLVFIKSSAETVEASNDDFAFTDGHAIMDLSDYYDSLGDLDALPWDVINARYWNDFEDGRRLRQSEFLVYDSFNLNLIEKIGVYDRGMKIQVEKIISDLHLNHVVEVKRNWYF